MTLPPEPWCWVGEPHYPEENPMNQLTTIPPRVRSALYLVSFLVGIGLGAIQVGYQAADAGFPVWLKVALSVYAFLAGTLGLTAAANTQTPESPRRRADRGQVDGWLGVVVVVLLLFILLAVLGALPAAR